MDAARHATDGTGPAAGRIERSMPASSPRYALPDPRRRRRRRDPCLAVAGVAGGVVFVLLYAALTVALVPGTESTLTAGLFGLVRGNRLCDLRRDIGARIAFLFGRPLVAVGLPNGRSRREMRRSAAVNGNEQSTLPAQLDTPYRRSSIGDVLSTTFSCMMNRHDDGSGVPSLRFSPHDRRGDRCAGRRFRDGCGG